MPIADETENVIRLDSAQAGPKRHFLGWQCRVRQRQMRHAGGQPSAGMRPTVGLAGDEHPPAAIMVLISHEDSANNTAKFRHMVRKTHDPKERLEGAVKELSAAYYQHPGDFSDVMTALFGPGSDIADRLLNAGRCTLHFDQYAQKYNIPCRIDLLTDDDPAWQATFWHNSLFNPNIPDGIRILAFTPDWSTATADPPPA